LSTQNDAGDETRTIDVPVASQAEAEAGTSDVKAMTPLRTDQYVDARLASQAEAEAGVENTKLMTPLRVAQAIDAQASSPNIQALLDGISSTQGTILYHNGTDWVALSPGTSGQFLKTNGAAANPAWAAAALTAYDSGNQTITAGGSLTLAHSLGVKPKLIQVYLIATGADNGYASNDELAINPHTTLISSLPALKSLYEITFVSLSFLSLTFF